MVPAKTYAALNRAFNFFNGHLFGGELSACLVTLQRKNKAYAISRAAGSDQRTAKMCGIGLHSSNAGRQGADAVR